MLNFFAIAIARALRISRRYFRQGRYWHNGVEGRISYLKRSFGFNRCLYRGDLGARTLGYLGDYRPQFDYHDAEFASKKFI
jgi:hypothetical protein